MADKRMTEDDVVAELRDGMTIGIGGWGSRRKPMSLVRAILRSRPEGPHDRRATAAPTSGCCARRARCARSCYGFVSLDSIPLEPHFRAARQNGAVEAMELDEGMLLWGLHAAALRLPFLPDARRASAPTCSTVNPELAHGDVALRRRRGARRDAGARRSTSRSST